MGNLQSLSTLSDEDLDKVILNNPLIAAMNYDENQKEAIRQSFRSEAWKTLVSKVDEIQKDNKFDELFKNYVTSTYEGSSQVKVKDIEAQKILDKYFPRNELNQHAKDMIKMFQTCTFKQLRESSDRYPEFAFWSSPLNYLFQADDPDFKEFMTKDGPIYVEDLVSITQYDKTITREVLTYLKTKYEN